MGSKPPSQEAVRTVDTVYKEAVLETERLRLEPLSRAHAAELFPVLADPRLYRFIPRDPPPSLASLEDRFQRLETRASPRGDEDWLNWVVRAKHDGQCIGRVEVTLRHADRSAYLAYELGRASWGQGIATEACRRVLATLWSDYGVSKVVAEVDTRNMASIRLLERLGFARGALRTHADFFKGESSDELTFTLTAHDDLIR